MISRSHRFHGHNSLRQVYQQGKTVRGPAFAVKSLLNPRRDSYRLAVVVSRKVHKSAVGRNRIRRRLYAAVRQLEDQISQPHDIVLTVFNDSVLGLPAAELNLQVKRQLTAAGILSR